MQQSSGSLSLPNISNSRTPPNHLLTAAPKYFKINITNAFRYVFCEWNPNPNFKMEANEYEKSK